MEEIGPYIIVGILGLAGLMAALLSERDGDKDPTLTPAPAPALTPTPTLVNPNPIIKSSLNDIIKQNQQILEKQQEFAKNKSTQ